MHTYNRREYLHATLNSTAAAATLKTMFPPRPIRVHGWGVTCKVAYVVGDTTSAVLTLDSAIKGTTTGTVKDTISMTAALAIGDHVYKDLEEDGNGFTVYPGQNWNLKVSTTNAGGSAAGTYDAYVLFKELGWSPNATNDTQYA